MFEAYKVGVGLALTSNVSSVLALVARDFIKTDKEAKKLQATLKEIKLLGMTGALIGGAGFMGLMAIKGAIKHAEDYARQLNNMTNAGMKQQEIAEAIQAAWENTSTVMTSSATGNLKTILDLRQALGATTGLGEVEKLLPIVTKMQAVMAASRDTRISGHGDELAFGMVKALDIIGAVNDPASLERQAQMMSKVIAATGGRVSPQMFQSVFQYARQSKFDLSDEFKYEILPTLMLEASTGKSGGGGGGSRGVGPMLAAMYRFTNQGYINKKSLPLLHSLGLVDGNTALRTTTEGTTVGAMKGAKLAASNSFEWVNQVLVPAIIAKYGNDPATIRQIINQAMRGNQLAASGAVEFYTKQNNFLRDQKINRSALPYDEAYINTMANDPKSAQDALAMQWENFKTSLGIGLIPVLIPFLRNLASAFNSLARFAQANQPLTQALMLTFTGLSLLATIGGSLMIAGAGIKLIGVGFGLLETPLLLLSTVPLVPIASGIALIAGALMALQHATDIGKLVNGTWADTYNPFLAVQRGASNLTHWMRGDNVPGAPPVTGGKSIQVSSQVNLDGRAIGTSVTKHLVNAMNGESISGNGFDGRLDYLSAGASIR